MADSSNPYRRATYQDIIDAPEHMVAEIVDGELFLSPRPAFRHSLASLSLADELVSPFQKRRGGPGGWWILTEPELHFGEDVLVPDLAGWRRERLLEPQKLLFATVAPDWLCETLSPSTKRLDRTKKLPVYARERVSYVWFVDPIEKVVEVYELQGDDYVLTATHTGHERIRAVPFDAIEIELADLWGEAPA
jgi:Uma2 family endonuclease